MLKHLCLLLLCTPGLVWAAGEAGNGGDVVVCRVNGAITSAKVLDFHEAEVLRPTLVYSLGDPADTPEDKVEMALTRLGRLDPVRARTYQRKADRFFSNVRFVKGVDLQDINDSGYVPIPGHCKIEQIAIQKPPAFPEDRLYTINRDLWDLLDHDHRAGLILHEIVYGELIGMGHRNSVKARYFTSLISSALMDSLSVSEYEARLRIVTGGGPLPGVLDFTSMEFRYEVNAGACLTVDLTGLLKGQGNGALAWNEMGAPGFVRIDSSNQLMTMCPDKKDGGQHDFRLAVRDQDKGALTKVVVLVRSQSVPPIWTQDPIRLDGQANQMFQFDLSQYAKDPDGDPLMFQKVTGPSWLMVSTHGSISGSPTQSDLGQNQFEVSVTDGTGLTSRVTVFIRIRP